MRKIILGLFIILFCSSIGIADNQEKKLSEEEKVILKKAIEIIKKHKERELLELMREASEPKEKELSWEEKYRMYPSTKYWLDSLKDPDERYLEKIEEENDRLEDLLRELRNEKSDLEWDMMRYKSDLEWHMLELSSRLEFDLLFNPLLTFPFDYRYTYPRQTDRTNYEPLLFTLCTDSKGKMDWTKYGWLKIWLRNK